MAAIARLARLGVLMLAACGRLGFDARASDASSDAVGSDGLGPPPTAQGQMAAVNATGNSQTENDADGTHMVFVDNTPGKNGDLVIFAEGVNSATLTLYVSTDAGVQWKPYSVMPTNTVGINALGACQDTVNHAFHVSWLDTTNADQYARLTASYTGGDITGFTVADNFAFFDDGGDSPGPRDLAEVVDADLNHRLVFAGSGPAGGSTGRYKLAITTPTAGLTPASQSDWAKATDHTVTDTDDQLLPNSYATSDGPDTYMVSVSSNLAGGSNAPFVVLAGMPADKKLLAWAIAPTSNDDFTISPTTTLTTSFGGGTGVRAAASLSVASAPSGDAFMIFNEDSTAALPGLHVARMDIAGTVTIDTAPQPSTDTAVRHAVIGVDTQSGLGVEYTDGQELVATLLWGSAWLPVVDLATVKMPTAAWSVTNVWELDGMTAFGIYLDASAGTGTTFASVTW